MHQAEIIMLLFAAVGVLAVLAHKITLPYPIVLVLGGLALSFVPRLPTVSLNPDVVFYFILPVLIYPAALFASWRDFRRNLRPILLLAIGLVLATMFAVAWSAHSIVPALPWAAAFALGAIVSPSETTNWHSFHLPGKKVSVMTSTLANFPHCCNLSSAGAAANAIVDTVCSLTNHTSGKHCASVAVCSDRSCDVEQGLISSFRVHMCEGKREVARTSDKRFQSLENRCGGSRIKRGENPSQRLDFVGLATNPKHAARNLEDAVDRLRNCRHGA